MSLVSFFCLIKITHHLKFVTKKLTNSVKQMFMGEAVAFVIKEADKGLECREYEKSDGENKVIYRTDLNKVVRA